MVESNILELNEIDHVLAGDRNAENILIDANGGDDTLVGGNKKDILKGGEGFDTYYAGDKDTITDSDGKGEVYFDKTKLTGGKSLATNKFTNSKKILILVTMKHSKNIRRAII